MVAARQLSAPIALDDFNPFVAAAHMAAWVSVHQECKPADTAVMWEFLKGMLALREALSMPTEYQKIIAMFKVMERYPELKNWKTAGVKSTRGAGRSFDIQRLVGLK